jgi:hypothetical protein
MGGGVRGGLSMKWGKQFHSTMRNALNKIHLSLASKYIFFPKQAKMGI